MSVKIYPKVFVVVLNYNGRDVIKDCLTSLFKLEYPNLEVIFVDNNSTDESFEYAKSNFSKATFIRNEANLGFSAGNNVGIKYALERMADYVLLLNNDTEVEKDFLNKLIEVMERDPQIGIASPVIFNGYNKEIWFSGGKIDWIRMKTVHFQGSQAADYFETEFVSGCSMLIKAEVFKKIGLLDEDYFLYWEDADFSFRAVENGFKNIVVSGSWVYHFEKSEKNPENKVYWLVLSGLIFFQKNAKFFKRIWIKGYFMLRRIKNWADTKISPGNKIALVVEKAYEDFQKSNI